MSEISIGKYRLVGGGCCPEQYDVFLDGKDVGYVRLRHGCFRVDMNHCGDPGYKTVYEGSPDDDGCFTTDTERMKFLTAGIEALDRELNKPVTVLDESEPATFADPELLRMLEVCQMALSSALIALKEEEGRSDQLKDALGQCQIDLSNTNAAKQRAQEEITRLTEELLQTKQLLSDAVGEKELAYFKLREAQSLIRAMNDSKP
jgi:hypothetical protein